MALDVIHIDMAAQNIRRKQNSVSFILNELLYTVYTSKKYSYISF